MGKRLNKFKNAELDNYGYAPQTEDIGHFGGYGVEWRVNYFLYCKNSKGKFKLLREKPIIGPVHHSYMGSGSYSYEFYSVNSDSSFCDKLERVLTLYTFLCGRNDLTDEEQKLKEDIENLLNDDSKVINASDIENLNKRGDLTWERYALILELESIKKSAEEAFASVKPQNEPTIEKNNVRTVLERGYQGNPHEETVYYTTTINNNTGKMVCKCSQYCVGWTVESESKTYQGLVPIPINCKGAISTDVVFYISINKNEKHEKSGYICPQSGKPMKLTGEEVEIMYNIVEEYFNNTVAEIEAKEKKNDDEIE